jgi:hypothetical protein
LSLQCRLPFLLGLPLRSGLLLLFPFNGLCNLALVLLCRLLLLLSG